jgi:hypothetical protein
LVSSIAVTEIVSYLSGVLRPQLLGRFLTIRYSSWETEIHEVLRIPRLERGDSNRPPVYPWKEVNYGHRGIDNRRT